MSSIIECGEALRRQPRPLSPFQRALKDLSRLTGATEQTVRQWFAGTSTPQRLQRQVIAEYLGKSEEELWGLLPNRKRSQK